MNLIDRNVCILTNEYDLEYLYTFENFPMFMGCSEDASSSDIKCDMIWTISKNTGIIQLKKLVPLDVLYEKSHGSGSVGRLWYDHHISFSKFISDFEMNTVLEIGGGHGILANNVIEIKNYIDWTIIEPNIVASNSNNINYIKGFFNEDFSSDKEFDTVIFSHLFEHIYDPNIFINQIKNVVKIGTKLIFSVPNMELMLKNKRTNCLNFEHTLFLTESYIEYLFSKNGFSLIQKEYFLEDHSIFYSYVYDNEEHNCNLRNDYEYNKSLFLDYIRYYDNLVGELNIMMQNSYYNEIYLFGAHIFSQHLISVGLDISNISAILDNDINKQGKRLYGTELYVESPNILSNKKNTLIILCAGLYNEEIKTNLLKINNNLTIFER